MTANMRKNWENAISSRAETPAQFLQALGLKSCNFRARQNRIIRNFCPGGNELLEQIENAYRELRDEYGNWDNSLRDPTLDRLNILLEIKQAMLTDLGFAGLKKIKKILASSEREGTLKP